MILCGRGMVTRWQSRSIDTISEEVDMADFKMKKTDPIQILMCFRERQKIQFVIHKKTEFCQIKVIFRLQSTSQKLDRNTHAGCEYYAPDLSEGPHSILDYNQLIKS